MKNEQSTGITLPEYLVNEIKITNVVPNIIFKGSFNSNVKLLDDQT